MLGRSRSTAVHRARRSGGLALVAVLAMVAAGCTDWTQRLGNDRHTTQNGSTAIAAGNATSLVEKWRMQPPACSNGVGVNVTGAVWFATPVTYKGVIYIGDDFGCLNAINEQTGAIIWRRYFNFLTYKTCQQRLGWVSSVNLKVENGVPVLYAYAPDNYAYKLRASDGSTIWRVLVQAESASTNDVYAWSSPTVVNGKVIIGVSSNCDTPFIQGKVHAFRASDGAWLWTHNTVPNGYVGAGDWYDAAVDEDGNVYVTTGSTYDDIAATHPNTTPGFEYYSLLKLNGDTGALIWKAPAPAYLNDPDYATSPILFEGGGLELVGAFNKDGWFRVYRRDNGKEVWQAKVGSQDMSEADHALAGGGIFDGTRLFVVSNVTKVGGGWNNIFPGAWQPSSTGLSVPGSIRELNPATGALVSEGGHPWEIGVAADIMGPCAINANDIVACAGGQLQNADINNGHQNGVYLFDTHSAPRILAHLEDRNSVGNTQDYGEFSEPIFEGNSIIATNNFYMTKWSLP